ncbi:hypothetical protein ACIRN4_06250 [Pimelobacter simplex]|uniref:hypothetical protein n=1 Tax=Nocardioides simplex TaxID=2045 RepID=UPI0038143F34
MIPTESVALARYIRAHFPQQPIDEFTAEALLELLEPYPATDARAAVLAIADRGAHWCSPTDVRAEVRRIRAKRIEEHPPLVPPPGLDDAEERRWLAGATRRIGDGETYDSDAPYELVHDAPRVRELLAAAKPAAPDDAA